MFTSKRFPVSEAPKDGFEFVTIPNFKPCRVKHNQYSAEVYVNCEPVITEKGSRTQTLNYRASSRAVLRDVIEQKHPDASFSTTGNTMDDAANAKAVLAKLREQAREETRPVTDEEKRQAASRLVRVYGHSEITLEKCLREGISERLFNALLKQETTNYIGMVTAEHRRLVGEMSEAEKTELTQANISSFVQESDWAPWFKQFDRNFFGFPDYTNANYKTLIRYCEARGWLAPMFGELDAAMRYLLAHSHFFLQHTYPRTQRDAYRAVRPFTGVIEETPTPKNKHQAAMESMKGLSARRLKENMQQIRNQNLSEDELRRRGSLLR